jgi:hypothetical protein
MDTIAREIEARCQETDKPPRCRNRLLAQGGRYRWRRDGESHQYNPETIPCSSRPCARMTRRMARYRQAVQASTAGGADPRTFTFNPADTPLPWKR